MEEEWRIIEDYPDYEISNFGSVKRRISAQGTYVGKIIKQCRNHPTHGYLRVRLCHNKKVYDRFTHRLVAQAFLGPCPHGQQVDHINFDRIDNHIENLRYLTPKQNQAHSISFGRNYCGERHHSSKLCTTDVSVVRYLLNNGYPILRIARFFDVNRAVIQDISRGKIWKSIPK